MKAVRAKRGEKAETSDSFALSAFSLLAAFRSPPISITTNCIFLISFQPRQAIMDALKYSNGTIC